MSTVWVWAPNTEKVELVTGESRIEMKRIDGDRFCGPDLPPGTDYQFSLNGGPPLPDPRSRWQPRGVHGPSRILDTQFEFTDSGFRAPPLASGVVYELHVGTFAGDGTFDGVIPRLPHLRSLGVTHVELMPIAEFPGTRGWGYDGVYPFAAHSGYGGPLALKRLVNACHAQGMGILLDVVFNHFGPDGNYLPRFGPYLVDTFHTPWGAAVNMDGPRSDHVRRFFIDCALQWMSEFRFDGLRLDAVHSIFDRSARHFLKQLAEETLELSNREQRPLILIAESDLNDPRMVHSSDAGGYGLDAQWSDDFHHALHVTLTGERNGIYGDFFGIRDLAKALERGFVVDGRYSAFRQRCHGAPFENLSLRRLVVAMQNHDQVGNRARGERITHLISPRRALLGAAVTLLGPSVPMLFQGEEWGARSPFQYFTEHHNPELARAVSEGRRREFAEFGWPAEAVPDPQAPETFEASRLNFRELELPEHAAILEQYRALVALRRSRPELSSACVHAYADERRGTLLIDRERSRVAVNFGSEAVRIPAGPLPNKPAPNKVGESDRGFEVIYGMGAPSIEGQELVLPPESMALLVLSA
ncbi:MAG TPA: malto-oligosyltrehalose trehalohydrolase [Polyangiaceae bacterium]|nr:malto-oligosyltrehalose trehalohydrolase [Polyangiaceae bacterium]